MSLNVAVKLEKNGYSIEVVDIRSLIPLDKDAILKSVRKTGKVLVVHEDKVFSGFGGELASMIGEFAFESLDGPVRRVGSAFTPIGFNKILEAAILISEEKIFDAALQLLKY